MSNTKPQLEIKREPNKKRSCVCSCERYQFTYYSVFTLLCIIERVPDTEREREEHENE